MESSGTNLFLKMPSHFQSIAWGIKLKGGEKTKPQGLKILVSVHRANDEHPWLNLQPKRVQSLILPDCLSNIRIECESDGSLTRQPTSSISLLLAPRKCGAGWNRTNDTVLFRHVLYQLSYRTINHSHFDVRLSVDFTISS